MKVATFFLLTLIVVLSCNKDKEEKICPVGYEGDNCDQEIEPQSITLESIKLKSFPSQNSAGEPWDWDDFTSADIFLLADPYLTIVNGATLETVFTSQHYDDVWPDTREIYEINLTCLPSDYFIITFYDYDSDGNDDQIGGKVTWNAYEKGRNFPTSINKYGAFIETVITVSYQH